MKKIITLVYRILDIIERVENNNYIDHKLKEGIFIHHLQSEWIETNMFTEKKN